MENQERAGCKRLLVCLQVDHGADREALGERTCLLEEEGEVGVHEAPPAQALQTGR